MCLRCACKDREIFGDYYWHTIHQAPGVYICPADGDLLKNTVVQVVNHRTRQDFVSAERALLYSVGDAWATGVNEVALRQLACDANWLAQQRGLWPGPNNLCERYRVELRLRGLATNTGRIKTQDLIDAFITYYSADFLEQLGCPLSRLSGDNWLLKIARAHRGMQQPLHHLLLSQFLGLTAQNLFGTPARTHTPRSALGAWPCLNKTCPWYGQGVISEAEITTSYGGQPKYIFRCTCGFAYSQVARQDCAEPPSPEDLVPSSVKIEVFGPVWEAALSGIWGDTGVSLREKARRLGVDPRTVKRHGKALLANQQDIPAAEASYSAAPPDSSPEVWGCTQGGKATQHRQAWLHLRKCYPGEGTKRLRERDPKVYTWLYRHDREWLDQHKPTHEITRPPTTRIDWAERDVSLAAKVREAATEITCREGAPIQVSIAEIGRTLGCLSLLQKYLDKLPHTRDALSTIVESQYDFAIRRIAWSARQFHSLGVQPNRWQLIRVSGVARVANVPQVREALDAALLRNSWGQLSKGEHSC